LMYRSFKFGLSPVGLFFVIVTYAFGVMSKNPM